MRQYLTGHWLALTAIILFFAASNLVWWGMDLVPPMWDQADYLLHAQYLYHALTEQGIAAFYASFLQSLGIKAPLLTALPMPLYLIFGNSYKTALLVNLAFMIAGSYFLCRLGELLLGRTEGILAVLILHTFPLVFAMSREFLVEYGLMVMVIAWYYFLLRSDSFQDRRASYALGVVLGLGLLMKISFPLYVIVPTLFALVTLIMEKRQFPAEPLKNSAIIVGIAVVLAGPWYLRNLKSVIDFAIISGYSERAREYAMGDVFSLHTILSYWLLLINQGITTYWFAIFLLALGCGVVMCKRAGGNTLRRPHLWVLVLWFMVPFFVFTLGINKDYRYVAPILPVVALVLGAGVGRLLKIRYAKIPAYILLVFPLFNFAYVSFSGSMKSLHAGPFVVLEGRLWNAHSPIRERWPLDRIVSSIERDAARNGLEGTAATLLFNHEYFNFINLNYYGAMQKARVWFKTNDHYIPETIDQALDRIRKESGYLITKSDQTGPDITNIKNRVIAVHLAQGELPFQRLYDIELPDKTTLTLYRKTIVTEYYQRYDGTAAMLRADVPCAASVSSDRWKGEYFANKGLSGPHAMTRDDGTDLNFNWNGASPSSQCGIGTENFSVRWTRDVAFKAGTHRFSMTVDDGGRLYVDGKLHIDKWLDQGASTYTVDIPLTAGSHHIVMEYYQHVGGTTAMLKVGTP